MGRFFRRIFKFDHVTSLGSDDLEEAPNGAVFAATVHGLHHYQDRTSRLGVEPLLQVGQTVQVLSQLLTGPFLVGMVLRIFRVNIA